MMMREQSLVWSWTTTTKLGLHDLCSPGEFEQSWGGDLLFQYCVRLREEAQLWLAISDCGGASKNVYQLSRGNCRKQMGVSSIFRGKSSKVSLIGGFGGGGGFSANAVVQVGKIRYLEVEKFCLISKSVMAIFII